ncbi:MAG TPA: hypothetical protein VFO34_12320 [Candidatus Acidoferrales bacterium]|nr:hypothetical protein [Candidatus Acidoferrales bacterium]
MEFRLVYQGELLSEKTYNDTRQARRKHKQTIRRAFHEQLAELWEADARLKGIGEHVTDVHDHAAGTHTRTSGFDEIGKLHELAGLKWVPLVSDRWGVACNLNILFLRHEPKGGLVIAGDLDNRIKTLFDALRMPKENELPDDLVPENEPSPYFCLLSDDKLITDFRVTADRLLVPSKIEKANPGVHLVIEVRTFIADHGKAQWYLMGTAHR